MSANNLFTLGAFLLGLVVLDIVLGGLWHNVAPALSHLTAALPHG